MTTWVKKFKRLIDGFLATESNKYITTESGLKIQILDIGKFSGKSKNPSTFSSTNKTPSSWDSKNKSS